MTTKLLSPVCNTQLFDNLGNMLSGGTVTVYTADSLNLAVVYANSTGGYLPNPVVLNSTGRIPNGQLYLDVGTKYDILVKSGSTVLESYSGITGILDGSLSIEGAVTTKNISVTTAGNSFPLGQTPEDISMVSVFLNGLILTPGSDYALSGSYIITSSQLKVGDELLVKITRAIGTEPLSQYTRAKIYDIWTTTAGVLTYHLNKTPGTLANLAVSMNGNVLYPTVDYTWTELSPLDLVLSTDPGNGAELGAQYNDVLPVLAPGVSDEIVYTTTGEYLTAVLDTGLNYTPQAGNSRSLVEIIAEGDVSVKAFGAVGDGIADDTIAIQTCFDTISNAANTTAFLKGGARIYFPTGTYLISKPIVLKSINTTIYGASASASLIKISSTFNLDGVHTDYGKFAFILDAQYIATPVDLYNVHITDLGIDINNKTDVGGIWMGGGRNGSSIERIQFLRFYSKCIELGKSIRDTHSVCQGIHVSDCFAIWDGNPGQHTVDRDGEFFVLSSANECVFTNVDAVSGSGETAIGCGFHVGSGTYQCGGNRFIGCGGSNYRGAWVNVASAVGFAVGNTVTTGDGFKMNITSIVGSTLKGVIAAGSGSKYVPRGVYGSVAGDTITNGTATTTIVSAQFGRLFQLSNSWNTIIDGVKVVETTVCGVMLDYATTPINCTQNVIRDGRFYGFTSSCLVAAARCSFNHIHSDSYVNPVVYLNGANYISTNVWGMGAADPSTGTFTPSLTLDMTGPSTTTNCVNEYLPSGQMNIRTKASYAVFSGNTGQSGLRASPFYAELFSNASTRMRDRDGNVRVETENAVNGYVALKDSSGSAKVAVLSNGGVLLSNLPTSSAGLPSGQLWRDASGFVKVV